MVRRLFLWPMPRPSETRSRSSKTVSPNVDDHVQVIYANQNWLTAYRGVSPEFFDIKPWSVDESTLFTHDDVERAAEVCDMGLTVRVHIFRPEDTIRKLIPAKDL